MYSHRCLYSFFVFFHLLIKIIKKYGPKIFPKLINKEFKLKSITSLKFNAEKLKFNKNCSNCFLYSI